MKRIRWFVVVLCGVLSGAGRATDGDAAPSSRIVVVGSPDTVNVSQQGYCSNGKEYDPAEFKNIAVNGGEQTWVHLLYGTPSHHCRTEFSFTPIAGRAYIVRSTERPAYCMVDVYLVVPGQAPLPQPIAPERNRGCLFGSDVNGK